jgi:hypothetical protein
LQLPIECHLSEFLAKAIDVLRIRCGSKVLGKFEERSLFLFFRLDTCFPLCSKIGFVENVG